MSNLRRRPSTRLSKYIPETRTLAKRFENLALVSKRIEFRCADGLGALQEFASSRDVVFFIDPPYTAGGKRAGKRLYRYFEMDHEKLFSVCEKLRGDFLITYDNADEVKAMARKHGLQMRLLPMTNTHHAKMEELVIGKDLSWMDSFPSVHEPPAEYIPLKKKRPSRKRANSKRKSSSNIS